MLHATRQGDLFALVPEAVRVDRALEPEALRETARQRLNGLLDRIRACAEGYPWPDVQHPGKIMFFHNAANWLPEEEREALRAAFRAECERLGLAVYHPA